ncbi:hypothetical protein [Maridesulfovibrio sp.]|uniref:hypothetical protein n=1 Tax=Maridesulfovibrio sp. TaxID=2795000 RepID=UPI0029F54483|nr:hypothetical protein [Maridesulfovibrio sp.]
MPNTITLPKAVITDAYDLTIEIQELAKSLKHHTFLETHQGEGKVLPGQLTQMEIMLHLIDDLLEGLDRKVV